MSKLLIIGHSLPRGYPSNHPAFPGRSQHRLCDLLGIEHGTLHQFADALNVYPAYPESRLGVGDLRPRAVRMTYFIGPQPWTHILFCGMPLAALFNYKFPMFQWIDFPWPTNKGIDLKRTATIPHPSGRNRLWNDPATSKQALLFMRDLHERMLHAKAS